MFLDHHTKRDLELGVSHFPFWCSDPQKCLAQANCKWLASEPVRFAFLQRGGKRARSATSLGSLADAGPTVNTLTSDLPVVLGSGANSGMLTLRKGSRMLPGRTLLLLGLGLSLCLTTLAATGAGVPARDFPPLVDSYHDQQIPSVFEKLAHRIRREPLNLVATIIFFAAIIHTFLTAQFRKIAHRYQRRYDAIEESLPATA